MDTTNGTNYVDLNPYKRKTKFDPFTEVPNMKPSRLLDCMIAKLIIGWTDIHCLEGGNVPYGYPNDDWNEDYPDNPHREEILNYSTEWEFTGMVLEKLEKDKVPVIRLEAGLGNEKWITTIGTCVCYSIIPNEAICQAAINYYAELLTEKTENLLKSKGL